MKMKSFIIEESQIPLNEQDSLRFIKDNLGEGKDPCHVTLVNDDGEQLLHKSLLHLVDLAI